MIEIDENIPFLWRLSSHNTEGFCVVSMVVPFNDGNHSLEHTIETDVMSFASDICYAEEEEILEWNEDDISLFLKLISREQPQRRINGAETIRVDLSDPETIEIIHIVAAAGFGLALPSEDVVVEDCSSRLNHQCDIGSHVSIRTIRGYKRCVVVDLDEEDAVCVMLEGVDVESPGQFDEINPHDLLLVKRHQLLHPEYTSHVPGRADVVH